MREDDFLDAVNEIEADVVESFVALEQRVQRKAKARGMLLRMGAIAACLAMLIGVITNLPAVRIGRVLNPPQANGTSAYLTVGNSFAGKQNLSNGAPILGSEGQFLMVSPKFRLCTVIEAEIIEVLPDTYYCFDGHDYYSVHIARVRVLDQIRGEGLPQEIYLSYRYYDTSLFDGYDRFIMSIYQEGIEGYALINGTQNRVDYFSNMFGTETWDALYGPVIAFRNGRVDVSFWEKGLHPKSVPNVMNRSEENRYPAYPKATLREVKANVIALMHDESYKGNSSQSGNYVTADDVFVTEEEKAICAYTALGDIGVYTHKLRFGEDRVGIIYTLWLNGFATDEQICVNVELGEFDFEVGVRENAQYTPEELKRAPDLSVVLAGINLDDLTPPHSENVEEYCLAHSEAYGIYRKVNGKIYGIIRVKWWYTPPKEPGMLSDAYMMDDLYYLYEEGEAGRAVEREELWEILGKEPFVEKFTHNAFVIWSY